MLDHCRILSHQDGPNVTKSHDRKRRLDYCMLRITRCPSGAAKLDSLTNHCHASIAVIRRQRQARNEIIRVSWERSFRGHGCVAKSNSRGRLGTEAERVRG
jgi:hypothetical protein